MRKIARDNLYLLIQRSICVTERFKLLNCCSVVRQTSKHAFNANILSVTT